MSTKKKLLLGAAGAAAAGGAGLDVDEVFSTTLYDGSSSAQTINNGIDLSGEGGMVWIKERSASQSDHALHDTERGIKNPIFANHTVAENTYYASNNLGITAFNSDGFTVASGVNMNDAGDTAVSWTFRKAEKFFDVQTWTGNGATTQISHSLGSTPGFWLFKRTDATGQWWTGHYDGTTTRLLQLESTTDASTSPHLAWGDFPNNSTVIPPTSTYVTFSEYLNVSGASFVGYFWASHNNDGEFGPDSDQDIIKCGSYTGNGSTTGPVIDLGFEPQWLMIKRTDTGGAGYNWFIFDAMRGMPVGGADQYLSANLTDAEAGSSERFKITPTGFQLASTSGSFNASGGNYIYMAIRRGPLTAPTDATNVFAPVNHPNDASDVLVSPGFTTDMVLTTKRAEISNRYVATRLTGARVLKTNATTAESGDYSQYMEFDHQNGVFWKDLWGNQSAIDYHWKRAPSYFDVVCWDGNSTEPRNHPHGLTVIPEMIWLKRRDTTKDWYVYHKDLDASAPETKYLSLHTTHGAYGGGHWYNTAPTSTVFTTSDSPHTNASGGSYIAYLFATVAGVSKVGSYTGSNSDQTIDCGFASGARFVLIKCTTDTQNWAVWDAARGIVSGNEPYLVLDRSDAEITGQDRLDPHSSGFTVAGNFTTGNAAGQSYIFYAIA